MTLDERATKQEMISWVEDLTGDVCHIALHVETLKQRLRQFTECLKCEAVHLCPRCRNASWAEFRATLADIKRYTTRLDSEVNSDD